MTGPTPKQARGRQWRRTSQGFYVPATIDSTEPEQRIAEASVLIPAGGGLTGWAALRWCGAAWFDGLRAGGREVLPVALATGFCDVRNQPGVQISQERLTPAELTVHDGLPMTNAVRSLWFEVRYAQSVEDAVVAVDMAAQADLVAVHELARAAFLRRGWTGAPRARLVVGLADENSWSPAETRVRLTWTREAMLPPPLCNVPIFDLAGHHIATPDLFDPQRGLAVEYDGRLHLRGRQRSKDARRLETMHRHGLATLTLLSDDMVDRWRAARLMTEAYRRAPATDPHRRLWTLEQPAWWHPTVSVSQRRQLTAAGLDHLLPRNRAA